VQFRGIVPPAPVQSDARATWTPNEQVVADAMADSEHAPRSEAIAGAVTGQLANVSNSGTEATAISRWCSAADRKLAVLLGGLS
jgi:hypothetical protein